MSFLSATELIVLCTFIVYSSCSEKPSITFISPEQVKNINESVVLKCTVHNPEDLSVIWMKTSRDRPTDVVILSLGSKKTFNDHRYQFTNISETSSYLLHITDIRTTDAGIYECQINSGNPVKSHVELLVRTPPHGITIHITSGTYTSKSSDATAISVTIESGHDAELKCLANGYPRPSISWFREHNAIMPGGGHWLNGNLLNISSVVKEDRGMYYCVAENVFGKDKKSIDFEVEFAPVISTLRAQAIDNDIEVECKVTAVPAPRILWYRDEEQLNIDNEYEIYNTGFAGDITYSVLRITTVRYYRYGEYHCKARNKVGRSEAKINLYDYLVD